MPRCRSSGALSISAKLFTWPAPPRFASTLEIAAVKVVLPWSMCPIVPTLACGFVRSNFCLAMSLLLYKTARLGTRACLLADLICQIAWQHFVIAEFHAVGRAALRHRAQLVYVAEHLGERHFGADHG